LSAQAPNRGQPHPAHSGREGSPAAQSGARKKFRRSLRLLKHADFDRVYKHGRRHFSSLMTVFYLRRESGEEKIPMSRQPRDVGHPRVGFTVGRVLGGAVDRNRIKRRLREAVRLQQALLTGAVDVVINPKKSVLQVEFSTLLEEMERAFELIARKMAEGRKDRAEI
jgi:ribonuclease P protein component